MKAALPLVVLAAVLQGQSAPVEIAKHDGPAVVAIRISSPSGEASGSGFIVDSSGTIVTNLHVIHGATAIAVKLANGDVYDHVSVRAFDVRKDLAVIQVAGFGLPTVPLGDSDSVQPGQAVVLIGNALGVLEGSVSTGVVSGVRQLDGFRVIQTDAAANPGNSGGPLLDSAGKAIGVLSFKLRGAENLNFVVPINYVRGLLSTSDSFSIDELTKRVSGSGADLLGASKPATFPTRWKSLASGATFAVRVEGQHVYVEAVLNAQATQAGQFGTGELTKTGGGGEKYAGITTWAVPCSWNMWTKGQHVCRFEDPIEITVLTPTRIEGSSLTYPSTSKFDCAKCSRSGKAEMRPFVWIPELAGS